MEKDLKIANHVVSVDGNDYHFDIAYAFSYEPEALEQKFQNLKEVIEFLHTYSPKAIELVRLCLSGKYKYSDPVKKAQSLSSITIEGKKRVMPDIDFDNIRSGIGGECESNSQVMYDEIMNTGRKESDGKIKIVYGTDNNRFSVHIFLTLQIKNTTIILDPSMKLVCFKDASSYSIQGKQKPISIETTRSHKQTLGIMKFDLPRSRASYSGESLPLGYIHNLQVFITFTIYLVNESYYTIGIIAQTTQGKHFLSFYDQSGTYTQTGDAGSISDYPGLKNTMVSILNDLRNRNVLQVPTKKTNITQKVTKIFSNK